MRRSRLLLIPALVLAFLLSACSSTEPLTSATLTNDAATNDIVILYTGDEHGWIEQSDTSDGAARLMGLWRAVERAGDGPAPLILSGGDMWTGPAVSTWFQGASTVEVMNAMRYDAAAIGNHEFDFGPEVLAERAGEMNFPLLAANVTYRQTGETPGFLQPYLITDVDGLLVGIVGLASTETPLVTRREFVEPFVFGDYEQALREVVPHVRADGAQVIVVASHLCPDEMLDLVPVCAELGISMVGGGHCHATFAEVVNGVALVEAGSDLDSYARVEISVAANGAARVVSAEVRPNTGGVPDSAVEAIVDRWRNAADRELARPIGYTTSGVPRDTTLYTLILNAWLAAYPADVAMSNLGGFRQAIPAGEITIGTIVGVLPFDNELVDVTLTGAQLLDTIASFGPATAGIDPREIDPQADYSVLVNDFMYGGGDGYPLSEYDPHAYRTGIGWRQPVIDWLISADTSPADPLDGYLH